LKDEASALDSFLKNDAHFGRHTLDELE